MTRERAQFTELTREGFDKILPHVLETISAIDEINPEFASVLNNFVSNHVIMLPTRGTLGNGMRLPLAPYMPNNLNVLVRYAERIVPTLIRMVNNMQSAEAQLDAGRLIYFHVIENLQDAVRCAIHDLEEQFGEENHFMLFAMIEQHGHEALLEQARHGSIEYFIHKLAALSCFLSNIGESVANYVSNVQRLIEESDSDEDQTEEEAKEDQIEEEAGEDQIEEGQAEVNEVLEAGPEAVEVQALDVNIEVVGDIVAQNSNCNCSM